MAEILGLGLSHYPPLSSPDEQMSWILRKTLQDPSIPPEHKDPKHWPPAMRAEWGEDEGLLSAATHRAAMVERFRHVRQALDDFKPDLVLIWGDDQYENFREDVIPAFSVCAYPDMDLYPWRHAQGSSMMEGGKPNAWGEGKDLHYRLKGHPQAAKLITKGLIDAHFDVAYAYKPLHHNSVAHAFMNAILYLDYERQGWPYPTVTMPINCYGRRVICAKGFMTQMDDVLDFDPPGPTPARCMDMGAQSAKTLLSSPWRVALVASSSWSHAFLCDKTFRLRPDTASDLSLYQAMKDNDFDVWRAQSTEDFEEAGQQEILNWCPLLGAMQALNRRVVWSDFVQTDVFNSNKVFALYADQ